MTDWSERIRALVDRHSSAPPGHVLRDQILAEIREYAFELLTEALAERNRLRNGLDEANGRCQSLTAERDQLLILRPLANRLRETLEKREAVILEHARTIMELRAELDQLKDGVAGCQTCGCMGVMRIEFLDGDGHATRPAEEVVCGECNGTAIGAMGRMIADAVRAENEACERAVDDVMADFIDDAGDALIYRREAIEAIRARRKQS